MARFDSSMEAMVDMFIFETSTLLEQLDEILMKTERADSMGEEDINEIFRIMHTIKGSSAMMGLDNMSTLTHAIEDMFYILRENKNISASIKHLYELVFAASDLLKAEVDLVQNADSEPTDFSALKEKIKDYIKVLKEGGEAPSVSAAKPAAASPAPVAATAVDSGAVSVRVFFEDGCQMENLRALLLVNIISEDCESLTFAPADIETNPDTAKTIIDDGFVITFKPAGNHDIIFKHIEESVNVKSYEVINETHEEKEPELIPTIEEKAPQATSAVAVMEHEEMLPPPIRTEKEQAADKINSQLAQSKGGNKQSLISVNLNKLDTLLDMVGELVITQAMVTANPDLKGIKLDSFQKASRQLRKLTDELQDIVMSIRMVPLSGVFNKMSRIVRDMKMKLNKDVDIVFEGEETEVDKSVIDNLNDPLMHLVRNAMDHGIETPEEHAASGKTEKSRITLSAFNSSGEVVILVQDNGKGINPAKVLEKAKKNGILTKPENEYTDKEIFNMIMLPGFSLKDQVTEFSGRGVGTDVVKKNIEKIGGSVTVESKFGEGTCFVIKIPLSLAIVDGMEVSVGDSIFTIPTSAIMESFKIKPEQLIYDTNKGEMIMIRGKCYPLLRLYENYGLIPKNEDLESGIIILVEADSKRLCLFVDELIGEQQVVVKPFSPLLNKFNIKQNGMAGCSILGDGSITIILDTNNIVNGQ